MLGLEIRDSNALRQALLLEGLELFPRRLEVFMLIGHVNEEQVDIVELELLQRVDERVPHGLASGDLRELRRDVQLGTGHACGCDALTDGRLVAVHLRRIDVSEAGLDRVRDAVGRVPAVQRGARAEAEPGDARAVVERDRERRHSAWCGGSRVQACVAKFRDVRGFIAARDAAEDAVPAPRYPVAQGAVFTQHRAIRYDTV